MARVLMGGRGHFGGRTRVYRSPQGVEIDEAEDDKITRKRVFWDDVLLVTLHKHTPMGSLIAVGIACVIFGLLTFLVAEAGARAAVLYSLFTWVPLLAYGMVRSSFGVNTVSVYGRRTLARMEFPYGAGKAREVYAEITRMTRRAQDATRTRAAKMRPAPPSPPVPPPPVEPTPEAG